MNEYEEEMKQENNADTAKAETTVTENEHQTAGAKSQEEEKLTQSQVNDIVTKRLAKQAEGFYKKYGVMDEKGMDDLVGKAKSYDELNKKYNELSEKNAMLNEKVMFTDNSIRKDREDDVRTYFKGKELPMTDENIKEALKTHNEWVNASANPVAVGNGGTPKAEEDEIDLASKLFGVNLRK